MTTVAVTSERQLASPSIRPANDEQPAEPVLDVEDVARLLRAGRNTIYELVGRNEIPHRRLGKQIRFSRDHFAVLAYLHAARSLMPRDVCCTTQRAAEPESEGMPHASHSPS